MNFKRLFIHHLPKSGGTHLITAVANALPKKQYSYRHQLGASPYPMRAMVLTRDVSMVSSHDIQAYWDNAELFDRMIITVRDPVDMCMSAWEYYRQPPQMARDLTNYPMDLRRQIVGIRIYGSFEAYLEKCPYLYPDPLLDDGTPRYDWCADPAACAARLSQDLGLPVQVPPEKYQNKTTQRTLDREHWRPIVAERLGVENKTTGVK